MPEEAMMGSLSCLNVAGGDVKITFEKSNIAETIRAKRMIADMLRRGYALLVEVDGAYQRAIEFDEQHGEYVVADYDPSYRPPSTMPTIREEEPDAETKETEIEAPKKKRNGRRRLAMESTNAVGVARSAGG